MWTVVPGAVAHALANGADGSIWHVGQNHKIYRWDGAGWRPGPDCAAVRVSAGRDGAPWHIGTNGVIYRWAGGRWRGFAGTQATELAIGGDAVWHIGTDGRLYRLVGGTTWVPDPQACAARRLAVQPDGTPWHIGGQDMVYRKTPDGWRAAAGPAGAITAGVDGAVYHAGDRGMFTWFTIYRWSHDAGWSHFSDSVAGDAGMLAVDDAGGLWSTPSASYAQVYRYL
jgi:hypothetical protein